MSDGESSAETRDYADHSPACQDANTLDYENEYIGECICRPREGIEAPDEYELWWCQWCGQEAAEGSDPCQECGEGVQRRRYLAVDAAERDRLREALEQIAGAHFSQASPAITEIARSALDAKEARADDGR